MGFHATSRTVERCWIAIGLAFELTLPAEASREFRRAYWYDDRIQEGPNAF